MRASPQSSSGALRRLLLAGIGATILLNVVGSPASAAERTVVIKGGGFGHGIGMSQYGAYGRALAGHGARRILEHYYTGVDVRSEQMPRRVRVGLLQGASAISFSSSATFGGSGHVEFRLGEGGELVSSGDAGVAWRAEATRKGGVRLLRNGVRVRSSAAPLGTPVKALEVVYRRFGSVVGVAQKGTGYAYGRLEIAIYRSSSCSPGFCLRLVNGLSFQKYLYGLGEVPSSWPLEALKAQTIAARTYAFRKYLAMGSHRQPCDCTIIDTAAEQVYLGDGKRVGSGAYWDRWRAAVDQTKDTVIMYRGSPIDALYSASSGGHTENNENVWGGSALPYLRGVNDRYDGVAGNPYHEWTVRMSWSEFSAQLDAYFGTGRVRDFDILGPLGVSGRVTVVRSDGGGVRIVGVDRKVRASGSAVKSALGLRDSLFRVTIR